MSAQRRIKLEPTCDVGSNFIRCWAKLSPSDNSTLLLPTEMWKAFLDYLVDITIGALHNWSPAHWVAMNIHEADAELFPSASVSRRNRCGGRHVLCMPTIKRRFWKLTKAANLPRFITDDRSCEKSY